MQFVDFWTEFHLLIGEKNYYLIIPVYSDSKSAN